MLLVTGFTLLFLIVSFFLARMVAGPVKENPATYLMVFTTAVVGLNMLASQVIYPPLLKSQAISQFNAMDSMKKLKRLRPQVHEAIMANLEASLNIKAVHDTVEIAVSELLKHLYRNLETTPDQALIRLRIFMNENISKLNQHNAVFCHKVFFQSEQPLVAMARFSSSKTKSKLIALLIDTIVASHPNRPPVAYDKEKAQKIMQAMYRDMQSWFHEDAAYILKRNHKGDPGKACAVVVQFYQMVLARPAKSATIVRHQFMREQGS